MACDTRPVRLAYDCTYALSPPTGIGNFATAVLSRLLRRDDITVTGYAVAWRQVGAVTDAVAQRLAASGPHGGSPPGVPVPKRTGVLNPKYARAAWKRSDVPPIEWFTGGVDVVHSPNYVLPPTRRAAGVVSVHDLTMIRYPQMATADTRGYPKLIQRAVERGAWVHTDTLAVADEVVDTFGAEPDRVRCVPLAADPVCDADAAVGVELAGTDRFILALGTVEPRKNLPRLVAAFDRLADDDPEVHLVLAGNPGWGVDTLEAATVVARNRSRIKPLGWVDHLGRAALLRSASVLAYPSLYEGFGIPPLEAMSVGTPVLAGRVGALTETCGDAALFCDPTDVDDIAGGLHTLLSDDSLRRTLIDRGVRHAAGFSWDRTTDGIVGLYRDATADAPGSPKRRLRRG